MTPIVEINLKNAVGLQRNRIITSAGQECGITHFLSPEMEENQASFKKILNKIWKTLKREVEIAFGLNETMTR